MAFIPDYTKDYRGKNIRFLNDDKTGATLEGTIIEQKMTTQRILVEWHDGGPPTWVNLGSSCILEMF